MVEGLHRIATRDLDHGQREDQRHEPGQDQPKAKVARKAAAIDFVGAL